MMILVSIPFIVTIVMVPVDFMYFVLMGYIVFIMFSTIAYIIFMYKSKRTHICPACQNVIGQTGTVVSGSQIVCK